MTLLSFTSHCCWSSFLLFHCKQCVIAACQWGRVWTRLQTELFTSFVSTGDTGEFYLEKTNCKLEGHPFSKVCFHSPVLLIPSFYVLNQQNMTGSLKLLFLFLNQFRVKHAKKWSVLNILVSFYVGSQKILHCSALQFCCKKLILII